MENYNKLMEFLRELMKHGTLELLSEGTLIRYEPFREKKEEDIVIRRLYEPYREAVLSPYANESLEEVLDYLDEGSDPREVLMELMRSHGETMSELLEVIKEKSEKGFVMTSDRKFEPVTRIALGRFLPDDWNPSYSKLIKLSETLGIELSDLVRGYETGIYIYRESRYYTGRFCTKAELRRFLLSSGIKPNRFLMTGSMADYRTLSEYASALALRVPEMLDLAMGLAEKEVFIPARFFQGPGIEMRYRKQEEAER